MSINAAGKMPKEVAEEWQPIWAEVVDLHSFWEFHRDLWGNPQHKALMEDILPGPFRLIRGACLTSIVMGIGRLFDPPEDMRKKKANLSFPRLLATIKQARPSDGALHQNLETLFDEAKVCYPPIQAWRHQRYGHRDKRTALGQEPLPDVDEQAVDKMLSRLRNLLQAIHTHFNSSGTPMEFPARRGDADALMRYIRRGYEAERAEMESPFL
jgi:AbiU2